MKSIFASLMVIASLNSFAASKKIVEFDPAVEKKCAQLAEQGKKLPSECQEILDIQEMNQ